MSKLSEALSRVQFTVTSPNGAVKLHLTMQGIGGLECEPGTRRRDTPSVFQRQLEMLLRTAVATHQHAYRTVVDRVRADEGLPGRMWPDEPAGRLQREIRAIDVTGESTRRKVTVRREPDGHFHVTVDPDFYRRATDEGFAGEVESALYDLYAAHRNESLRAWKRELPEVLTVEPLTRVGDE